MDRFEEWYLRLCVQQPFLAHLLNDLLSVLVRLAFALFGGPTASEACWPETVLTDDV